jgi:serine acetyltransferase
MLSDTDKSERDAARRAFQEYLKGPCDKPFLIATQESYCLEEVLYPTLRSRLGVIRRSMLVWLGGIMPFCPAKAFFYSLAGVRVGRNVCFSPGVVIDPLFPALIHLEDDCCLGMGCRLLTHDYTASFFRVGPIRVGRGSVVGAYSTVRNGVTIGAKATIGANSFVNKNVPDGATVGGVPARHLKVKSGNGISE